MIVYVESNFVLEVALEQEQASSAEDKCFLSRDRNALAITPRSNPNWRHTTVAILVVSEKV